MRSLTGPCELGGLAGLGRPVPPVGIAHDLHGFILCRSEPGVESPIPPPSLSPSFFPPSLFPFYPRLPYPLLCLFLPSLRSLSSPSSVLVPVSAKSPRPRWTACTGTSFT